MQLESKNTRPSVMVVGYHHVFALQIIAEIRSDLDVTTIGVAKDSTDPIVQSKYCDTPVILRSRETNQVQKELARKLRQHKPDVVIPVGYKSVLNLDSIRDEIPEGIEYRLPPSDSLRIALDKSRTAEIAQDNGIDVPTEYFRIHRDDFMNDIPQIEELSYPVFLKARRESGRNITSRVGNPDEFEDIAEELLQDKQLEGEELLVQEYIPGDGHTYGCGFLFDDGKPVVRFGQKELRSIPRGGGSGTRVSVHRDEQLEDQSIELLKDLDWEGFALVEYRKRANGMYTLMEVNPKVWASYPLASRAGYRSASKLVTNALDIELDVSHSPSNDAEMVFPLREFYYTLKHWEDESLLGATKAMFYPPAPMDVHVRDLRAWVFPAGFSTRIKDAFELWRHGTDPVES